MARFQIVGEIDIDYVLVMNMMRNRTESVTEVRRFDTPEQLREWYNEQLVEPYTDDGPSGFHDGNEKFRKCFRKGSELEWFNPLTEEEFTTPSHHGRGVHLAYSNLDIFNRTKIG